MQISKCGSSDSDKAEAKKRAMRAKRLGIETALTDAEEAHQQRGKKHHADDDIKPAPTKRRSNNDAKNSESIQSSKGLKTNPPSKKRKADYQEPEQRHSSAKRHRQEPRAEQSRHIPTYTGRNDRRSGRGVGRERAGSSYKAAGTTNGLRNRHRSQSEGRRAKRR